MAFLKFNNFKGVNTEDEVLSPNVLTFGLNTDTSDGRLKKRSGIASLVDVTDIPKGLHKARFQSGETLVLGADTEAYKLSGTQYTDTTTTTAQFALGTFDKTIDRTDKVGFDEYIKTTTTVYTLPTPYTTFYSKVKSSFSGTEDEGGVFYKCSTKNYGFFMFEGQRRIRILDGGTTISGGGDGTTVFTSSINFLPAIGNVFYISVKHDSDKIYFYKDDVLFYEMPNIHGSLTETNQLDASLNQIFYIGSSSELYGEYISKIFDLGQTPVANALTFSTTTSGGDGSIAMYARGSDDGVRFGDWGIVSASGDSINLNRYIQIRAIITRLDPMVNSYPTLNDFTITYTKTFDTATQFDTGLTGNKIRWVNYQGQAFTTTGSISSGSPTLTVASGTGFANGQTVFVEGAGSAGGYLEATVSNVVGTTITLSTNASTTVSGAYVRIELYSSKYYVYYCDGTNVKKYDGTTVTALGSVPASNIIYEHKGYMFYVPSVDPTRLYFSDVYGTNLADPLGDFESVQPQSFKQFSSPIKGLRTFEGKLVVSGNDFTAFVTGNIFGGANDDTVIYTIDDIGVTNHESMAIASTNNGTLLALVTNSGIRYLTGGVYENALQQAPLSETVAFYLKDGNFDNSWAFTFKNKLYVGFDSGVLPALYNDSVLVWDFRRGVIDGIWSLHLNDCAEFNNVLYGSSSEDGNLYELLTGSDDNGSDIHMMAKMRMHIGEVKATAQKFNIKATTDSDFDNSTKTLLYVTMDKTKELDLKEGRWRVSETALPQWKGQDLMEQKRNIKKRGTFIEITVDIESSKPIEFDSFELEYEGVRK